ncbi:MAG: CidA/LrgA family protein [Steroidobacteraceae bacterium]
MNAVPLQLGGMVALWLVGELLARLLHLPVPGPVVGLGLLLALLASGAIALDSVKRGADWLLAQMLVFFVPAVLSVVDHREFFGVLGLKILFVIAVSTLAVMVVTSLIVEHGLRATAELAHE